MKKIWLKLKIYWLLVQRKERSHLNKRILKLRQLREEIPIESSRIEITWLPGRFTDLGYDKNAYIGSQGIVEDLDVDGGFVLNMGDSLLIVSPGRDGKVRYKFKYI